MANPQGPRNARSIAVVLPCRNEAKTIASVLDAIEQQDLWPDEIIVVDDGSSDATVSVVGAWCARPHRGAVRVVTGPGRGPAAAMNKGIGLARSEFIVRLDGHSCPRPDYISRSIRTLIDRKAGVVGGVWDVAPGAATNVARAIAAVLSHPIGSGCAAYRDATRALGIIEPVDTVPFGCYPRAVWEAVGGYDEHLVANEDYDFNYRVREAGLAVLLNTDIRSAYGARPTLQTLGRQYFRYGFWKMQMLRKSPAALRLRQVLPVLLLPLIAITALLAVSMSSFLPLLAAAMYPALIAAAVLQMHATRRDMKLIGPAFAAVLVQHLSWCAGFWHGLLYPPPKPA
ncbi:MAG: glycosyltransferase family 2 protein [Acidobacteriota bacterium]|nr:glycosyltransferase family 2 protein [Acidobacteriota bacterium]